MEAERLGPLGVACVSRVPGHDNGGVGASGQQCGASGAAGSRRPEAGPANGGQDKSDSVCARWANQRSTPNRGILTAPFADTGQNVPCTIFKVPQKSNLLLQTANHLFYTQEGISSY